MRRDTSLAIMLSVVVALAGCDSGADQNEDYDADVAPGGQPAAEVAQPGADSDEAAEARELANDASQILTEMQSDAELQQALNQARGVFIAPHYGRGGVVVGANAGEGVLLARRNGQWSSPAFYDFGGVSVGAQLGGEGGAIALVLMSDKALNSFLGDNTFNLDAESGLTIIDYSGASKATLGTGDVVMWSDVEGLFAGATLGANGFSFDDEANRAVYGRDVSPQDIVNGQVTASVPMGDM